MGRTAKIRHRRRRRLHRRIDAHAKRVVRVYAFLEAVSRLSLEAFSSLYHGYLDTLRPGKEQP